MKRGHIRLIIVVFAMIFTLTGCGTALYELTEDEEQLIVHYAAYVVSKYNIVQTDGLNGNVVAYEEETEAEVKQENTDKPDGDTANQGEASDGEEGVKTMTLAEAIGTSDLDVSFNGFSVSDSYQEGGYYSLTPVNGKKYVVMNFTISNPYAEDKAVDAMAVNPSFYASFNGGGDVEAESTFLTYSLSTFNGKIKSGKSVEVVLLFQVDGSTAKDISNVELKQKREGTTYTIEL